MIEYKKIPFNPARSEAYVFGEWKEMGITESPLGPACPRSFDAPSFWWMLPRLVGNWLRSSQETVRWPWPNIA